MRLYNMKQASPRVMLKVNIRKAYDSVNWSFLQKLLAAYKFPQTFIRWLSSCIQTVTYALVINGEVGRRFEGR